MIDNQISCLYLKLVSIGCKKSTKVKILNVFIKVFMNTNTFEMYSNTNTNALKNVFEYL